MICAYLERSEPTNPAQLLLRRAERLIDKSFLQLVRDLGARRGQRSGAHHGCGSGQHRGHRASIVDEAEEGWHIAPFAKRPRPWCQRSFSLAGLHDAQPIHD